MTENLVPSETTIPLKGCIDFQESIFFKRGNCNLHWRRMKRLGKFFFRKPEGLLQKFSVGNIVGHPANDGGGNALCSKRIVVLPDSPLSGLCGDSLLAIQRDGFVKGSMRVITKTGERRILA